MLSFTLSLSVEVESEWRACVYFFRYLFHAKNSDTNMFHVLTNNRNALPIMI